MRRFLLAAGLLILLAATPADAGYLVVRIILEGGGGAGAGGAPGSMPGGPGAPGVVEGSGPPMPPPGLGPPSGGQSGRSGPPPGSPYGGQPGGPSMFGGGAGADGPHDPTRSIFVVVPITAVPKGGPFYPSLKHSPSYNPNWQLVLKHPFGTTNLLVDSTQIELYSEPAQKPTPTKTFPSLVLGRFDDWKRSRDDGTRLLTLVTEALEVGLVDEAGTMADELLAAVQAKKASTTPAVDRFVAAYAPLKDKLRNRVANTGDGQFWKDRLGLGLSDVQVSPMTHFNFVTTGGLRTDEVARRSEQLETNLRAFYLWHAARGIGLPLPDRQMTVILAGSAAEVRRLREALDVTGVVADGFYAPDHDVLVLSPERIDDVGMTFQRQVNGYYRIGASRDRLLHPESYTPDRPLIPLNDDGTRKEGKKAAEVARMMTWAMADAFNQRDSEVATASREGSRQLFYATGLLPKHVSSPAWLAHGSAEFFHRPRGAVFTDGPEDKTIATVGLTTGYGGPNFAQQKLFRDLVGKKVLPTDPAVLLKNVVTDTYFTAVSDRLDADDPKLPKPKDPPAKTAPGTPGGPPMPGIVGGPPMPGLVGPPMPGVGGPMGGTPVEDPVLYARRRHEFLVNKARSTAWALYYHLATNDPAGLRRYFAELDKLPRDMPFDGATNWAAFTTAFNLTASATPEAGKVPVGRFAQEWLDALAAQRPAGEDLTLHAPAPPATTTPGGFPMPPGGLIPGRPGPGSRD